MARKARDHAAEYRRRKELQAERARAAARAKKAAYQRDYRRRLKEAKAAGFGSVREYEQSRIPAEFKHEDLPKLIGKRKRGSKLPKAGEIARLLGARTRAFFGWWYGTA